jgi:hypothetical protein
MFTKAGTVTTSAATVNCPRFIPHNEVQNGISYLKYGHTGMMTDSTVASNEKRRKITQQKIKNLFI